MKPTVTTVVSVHMTGEEATELRRSIYRVSEYVAEQNKGGLEGRLFEHMAVLNQLKTVLPLNSK